MYRIKNWKTDGGKLSEDATNSPMRTAIRKTAELWKQTYLEAIPLLCSGGENQIVLGGALRREETVQKKSMDAVGRKDTSIFSMGGKGPDLHQCAAAGAGGVQVYYSKANRLSFPLSMGGNPQGGWGLENRMTIKKLHVRKKGGGQRQP